MRKVAVVFARTFSVPHEVETQFGFVQRILLSIVRADDWTAVSVHEGFFGLNFLHRFLVRRAADILTHFVVLIVHAVVTAQFALIIILNPVIFVVDQL